MNKKKVNRAKLNKGFTMVELVATLVVMSLVLGVIALFTIAINNNAEAKIAITTQMKDIQRTYDFVDNWYNAFDSVDFAVVGAEDGLTDPFRTYVTVRRRNSALTYTLEYVDATDKLVATYPDGEVMEYVPEAIESARFDWDDASQLMKCTLTYGENHATYTFILGRHA